MGILKTKVHFIKTDETAQLPTKAHEGDAGWDLYAAEDVTLAPGDWKLISTGLLIALPDGMEGQVRPRSGLALKRGVTVLNSPGTIDAGYRGSLGVVLINHSKEHVDIMVGDRIAQLVIQPVIKAISMCEVESFDSITARGFGGFGSTGN